MADFKWAEAGGGGGGAGTVTSVGMTVPSALLAVSGSPITTTGTFGVTLPTRAANLAFAGPRTGADAAPTFRALVSDDIPNLDAGKITTGTLAVARGGTNIGSYTVGDLIYASGTTTLSKLAIGTAGQLLHVNAGATALEYISTVPVAQGGTNLASYAVGDVIYASGTTTLAKLAIGTANQQLRVNAGATALEYFTPAAATGDVVGQASATDNAICRYDLTTGKLIQNSPVTIDDTTGAMTWTGTPTQDAIKITGGTVANNQNLLNVTGTLNPGAGATVIGDFVSMATAGSNAAALVGIRGRLTAGHTGASFTSAMQAINAVAGTGANMWNSGGNFGLNAQATGSTSTGYNIGGGYYAVNGKRNHGINVGVDTTPNGGTGQNCGGFFTTHPGNLSNDVAASVYGVLSTTTVQDLPAGTIAAGVFNNGSVAADILVAMDNGSTVFKIKNGGGICTSQSAAATLPGTVTGKLEIFDASGASLGFIAIYDAIT